jgi:polysaccharide biosynthesis protein PslH
MARILLLTPQLPYPPEQGTSLRNYHILRGLAAAGRPVTLLSYAEAGQATDPAAVEPLTSLCQELDVVPAPNRTMSLRLVRLLTDRRPDMAHRLASPAFDQALMKILAGAPFAIVQIEGIELAHLIPLVRQASPASKIVFDDHNAEAELQYRAFRTDVSQPRRWPAALYSWIQTGRLRRFERWAGQEADWTVAVSQTDRDSLLALGIQKPITVIPNSIDVQAYQFEGQPAVPAHDLVFSGKMDYRPNIDAMLWFGQKIWPLIRERRPETTWAVVGQKPHPRLEPLRRLPGVSVTGRVPSVAPYLAGARVVIMPFRMGSGTRLKLIEAMAAGKAVVSTSLGAEGFTRLKDGNDLLLADSEEAFAAAVLLLLADPAAQARLGAAARAKAQEYDWRVVVPAFLDIYSRLQPAVCF